MSEQKPTAEATNLMSSVCDVFEKWGAAIDDDGRPEIMAEGEKVIAAALAAKDAEIERLKSLAEWAHTCTNHTDRERAALNQRCPVCLSAEIAERNSWLEGANANLRREQTKNQQQRAEIDRLRKRVADLEHDANLPRVEEVQAVYQESKLLEQNQQQRALLVEACRLLQREINIGDVYGYVVPDDFHKFLSTPAVVELLKGVK